VRVYTIAFGADAQRGPFGMLLPSAEIDEATLHSIADATGGRFFRARDTAELAGIYAELDRLEQIEHVAEQQRIVRELYPWPAGAALVLSLLALFPLPPRMDAAA
jgi:Ca-activated chloride channel family protein